MKALDIFSSLPGWANMASEEIFRSSAFAAPCRIGETPAVLRQASIAPSDTLELKISIAGAPHILGLTRTPSWPELDKIWDSRSEVPTEILLALVEKECGAFLQMLENVVRGQIQIGGVLDGAPDENPKANSVNLEVAGIVFSLTASPAIIATLGVLRNLDLTCDLIRSVELDAETEYAAFALNESDVATLAPGDVLLLPEIGAVAPREIVENKFAASEKSLNAFSDDGLYRVIAAETKKITLGELFDIAAESAAPSPIAPSSGMALKLVKNGRIIAFGRLEKLGDVFSFTVEAKE